MEENEAQAERFREQRRLYLAQRGREVQAQLEGLSDWELIADAPGTALVQNPMVMQMRLMDAMRALTAELAGFKETSRRAAEEAADAANRLETLTTRLYYFTIALTLLTVVLIFLAAATLK